jgi:starch synthase
VFDREMIGKLELKGEHFVPDGFEFYGKVNVFKAGLLAADRVTTVSPTYAREILDPEGGVGLHGVLATIDPPIRGILNGVDVETWNPADDMRLVERYDPKDISGKAACKKALQEDLGLPVKERAPLVGFIARLVPQKGVDLLLFIAPRLLRSDVQLAVLGTGDADLEEGLGRLASRYDDKVAYQKTFDDRLSHRFYAGCDMLVVPSRFEPCGLSQLIGMRYGTIPVVRRTGGLADTVVDLDRDLETGNGFVFKHVDPVDLLGTILRGVVCYSTASEWSTLVKRVMEVDVSWDRSAKQYLALYTS